MRDDGSVPVRIADIVFDERLVIRDAFDEEVIARYSEQIDDLPPILLYNVERVGLVQTDGAHRVEAARRRGREDIRAVIKTGTLAEALAAAIKANSQHGKPLTVNERRLAVTRLQQLKPAWSLRKLSKATGIPHTTIALWRDEDRLIAAVPDARGLTAQVRQAITVAPEQHQPQLVEEAIDKHWSTATARKAVRDLADGTPATPDHVDTAFIEQTHLVAPPGDEPATASETAEQRPPDSQASSDDAAVWRFLTMLTKARGRWTPEEFVHGLDIGELEHVESALPVAIEFLRAVLAAAGAARHRFTAIPGGRRGLESRE